MTTPTHSSDTELFELCKKVYERTGWQIEKGEGIYRKGHYWSGTEEYQPGEPFIDTWAGKQPDFPYELVAPLYTSDYLLEKLPASVQDYYLTLGKGDEYCAEYADSGTSSLYRRNADTPLKSLLKLTIALHESGEIR